MDLKDRTFEPEKEAIRTAYRYSLFSDGVFLLDKGGTVFVNYPERVRENTLNVLSIEPVNRMIAMGIPVVSNIYTLDNGKKILYVLVPLKDRNGSLVGVAGGQIDPTNPTLAQKLGLADIGRDMFIDLVDSNGVIISSSNPTRILTQCNRNKFFTKMIEAKYGKQTENHACLCAAGILALGDFHTGAGRSGVRLHRETEKDLSCSDHDLHWNGVPADDRHQPQHREPVKRAYPRG